jgi:hypothetical protein
MTEQEGNLPCQKPGHRVVPIRFSRRDAEVIREQLAKQLGAERVSRLRDSGAQWMVVICPACAENDQHRADGERAS